jgi:hypothetical protein
VEEALPSGNIITRRLRLAPMGRRHASDLCVVCTKTTRSRNGIGKWSHEVAEARAAEMAEAWERDGVSQRPRVVGHFLLVAAGRGVKGRSCEKSGTPSPVASDELENQDKRYGSSSWSLLSELLGRRYLDAARQADLRRGT